MENRYLDSQNTASINANTTAAMQKVLDTIYRIIVYGESNPKGLNSPVDCSGLRAMRETGGLPKGNTRNSPWDYQ